MFIRRKNNRSGSKSVQLISKANGKYKVMKSFGSSKNEIELNELEIHANQYLKEITKQGILFESI